MSLDMLQLLLDHIAVSYYVYRCGLLLQTE